VRSGGVALVMVALISVAGCSSGGDGATAGAAAGKTAASVAGRYAHYDVVAYESSDMKTLIISYGFTDLTEQDGELIAKESFCHSEHRSDQPITTEMSDAATSAIRPPSTPVTVTEKNGRIRIQRPRTPTGIGIRLEDPANDSLPTDPDDPRIADDDNDGKPGVTVRIKVTDTLSGELYIARREIFAYDVLRQDDGSLTGTVDDHSEQLIVGASDDMFKTEAAWIQHPDPSKSPIILEPVDKSWDCARLMSERDRLFPPTPEVDW
jgi:hypothetical protein